MIITTTTVSNKGRRIQYGDSNGLSNNDCRCAFDFHFVFANELKGTFDFGCRALCPASKKINSPARPIANLCASYTIDY